MSVTLCSISHKLTAAAAEAVEEPAGTAAAAGTEEPAGTAAVPAGTEEPADTASAASSADCKLPAAV